MFWLYVGENALTIVAALALYPWAGAPGLAAAWIGSYSLSLPFAWRRLRRSVPIVAPAGWLGRAAAATVVMAVLVAALLSLVPATSSLLWSSARLVFVAAAGAATFIVTARALGITELNLLSARYRSLVR